MVSYIKVEVPELYPYVLFVTAVFAIEYLLINFSGGSVRSRVFNQDYLHKHFGQDHHKYFKESVPKGGYPDCGNGIFSKHISYKDWYEFNLAQRASKNFLECFTMMCFGLLLTGLVYTQVAIGLGASMIVLRFLYTLGYRKSAFDRIKLGAPLLMLC